MSRQLLVIVKCNNNKDIARGIYNPKNSELKESKFNALQLADLQDEVEKVLNSINGYKTIKFAWNVSSKNGEVENKSFMTSNKCYSNNSIIHDRIPYYFSYVNKI